MQRINNIATGGRDGKKSFLGIVNSYLHLLFTLGNIPSHILKCKHDSKNLFT